MGLLLDPTLRSHMAPAMAAETLDASPTTARRRRGGTIAQA